MDIVVFEAEEWEAKACAALTPHHTLSCTKAPLRRDTVGAYAMAEAISPFVESDLRRDVLECLPRLKLIATRSTGFDHIDLAYCRSAGVTVCNVPDYGDHTVAEHAFALLLSLIRKIPEAGDRVRRGDFSTRGLRGFELAGKTLGVIGAGRIGRRAIEIGRGFSMEVLAFDMAPDLQAAQDLGFQYVDFVDLLSAADVITVHVPGGGGSQGLISDPEFALMKPGAILINTARGGVVDPEALIRAIDSGRLGGAGLDVIAEEKALRDEAEIFRSGSGLQPDQLRTMIADHALLRFPNVLITPHIAYDTREAVGRIIDTSLANIEAFAQGAAQNVVR
ncbi:D-lactate dehydrogenase [Phenylobacterium haematophilum]|jgi:D-lactate dehydrogenase|uniref:D-lactate dehydrogenase n=1 Tax=Phenylobacterium haematophilum TaxID=98513 RepID=A0A840A655_9CAUL|nr:hydroxyacid dehydrogenase [Phenylobacterium haematophilum]MBB3892961.1 D-lactate dehydrogenase [Phenylobacterium haematophilum]